MDNLGGGVEGNSPTSMGPDFKPSSSHTFPPSKVNVKLTGFFLAEIGVGFAGSFLGGEHLTLAGGLRLY